MSQSSFGNQLSARDLNYTSAGLSEKAVFGPVNDNNAKNQRRSEIKKHYNELIQNNAIQQLKYTTHEEYSDWFMVNVMNKLETNEYDGQDKDIKALLNQLKEQYRQVLKAKNLSRPTKGGSHRKHSKRRLRKTQQRRKRNNRKSKKSKQV